MAGGLPSVPSSGSPVGATVQAEYMGRTVRCYPVHETEMEGLTEANGDATAHFAFASAFLAFAVGIWTNAMFATELTASGELATTLAAPVLIVLSVFFGILGLRASARRNRIWNKIKSEAINLHSSATTTTP